LNDDSQASTFNRSRSVVFVVAAKVKAKQGAADTLADMFRDMVAWVAGNEPETVSFSCNRSTDDPDLFLFFERYASKQAFRAHAASDRFLELAASMQGLIDGAIQIETYDEIAAKP
jgi:quinol monooxygenase YgiN